ncbi:hypothetical protein EII34_11350 [Arachnia propionica]|uniref:Uncharacterized protein n=1 Tax=Arachnia propionica TaxID=1750 RepID=A0A3P1T709_9ACTN|nr:hypothetical protein [Arachnia propionica]MDO5084349.1 hypothetical protein [Arachnia propionica]RRD04193.1 hypothetical protein EII34_11350 [Arachnia propionica]
MRPRLDRLAVAAWCLVALLITAVVLGATRISSLTAEVYEDAWRGRYDILVTAPGLEKQLSPGSDAQGLPLLDPNFTGVTTPTMSLEKLDQIRSVHDVEVAAPIGFLGSTGDVMNWPLFFIPWSELPDPVTTFQITWTITGDDGLGDRLVMERTNTVKIDHTNWTGKGGRYSTEGVIIETDDPVLTVDGTVSEQGIEFSWWLVTVPRSTIFTVDPIAEADLLADAGEFLKPLAEFDEVTREHGPVTVNGFSKVDSDGMVKELDDTVLLEARIAEFPGSQKGQRAALMGWYGVDSPFVGFLRNTQPYAPTDLAVSIDQISDNGTAHVGDLHLDLAAATRPFNGGELEIGWPTGDQSFSQDLERYAIIQYNSEGLTPLDLEPRTSDSGVSFTVTPQGFRHPITQLGFQSADGTGMGQEQSYRRTTPGRMTIGLYGKHTGAAPFEVGTYTPQDLDSGASYVPLGAYDPALVRVKESGQMLTPARNAQGLAAQPSSAIVSLQGAQELTDEDFISAVRIRVAGLDGLSRAEAMPRIDAVAAQLRGMGLEAFVVAGASLQSVDLWVPQYAFGTTDPEIPQQVGDLGWVTQNFTTLGAVTWSETTTAQVVMMLFAAAITIAGVLLIGVGLLTRPRRTADHALLVSLGWSHWTRFRWTLLAQWPGLLLVLAATVTGILLAPGGLRWMVGLFLVMAVLATTATHPHRPPASFLTGRLGSRRRLIGLSLAETLLTGLAASAFAIVGAAVGWYQQVTTNTRVATAVGEVLTSFLAVAALLIVVVAVIQAATTRLGEQTRGQRARFHYWHLGTSRRRLVTRHLATSLVMLVGALLPPLAVLGLAHQLALPVTLAAILSAGWLLSWALLRATAALRWKP